MEEVRWISMDRGRLNTNSASSTGFFGSTKILESESNPDL